MKGKIVIKDEQELMLALADMAIALYTTESLFLHSEHRSALDLEDQEVCRAMVRLKEEDLETSFRLGLRQLTPLLFRAETQKEVYDANIQLISRTELTPTVELQRLVTKAVEEKGGYFF